MQSQSCLLPLGRTAATERFSGRNKISLGSVVPRIESCMAERALGSLLPVPAGPTTSWRSAERSTQNWRLIAFVFLPFVAGYYLSYLFRTINALISGYLTSDLSLDAADLGLLTSIYFLTFGAAQIPIGMLLDRYGPRRVQSVLLLVAAAGAALFGASQGFLPLVAARAMIGLGVAAALTGGLKAIVLWFPRICKIFPDAACDFVLRPITSL